MDDALRGASAGLVGTSVMTAAYALLKVLGTTAGELPPRKVSRHAEEAMGVRQAQSQPGFEANWVAQHFAFGASMGVAYALVHKTLKGDAVGPVVAGSLFGIALWASGYGSSLPAAGLYPSPGRQPRRRVGTEIATHLVYGMTTAWAYALTANRTHVSTRS